MEYFHFNKDCLKINNYILNALNLISYSFVCLFFFFFFLVRLIIMKLLHLLKAKRTHDFRWKKPNEAKTRSYNNITMDFEYSLV